MLCLFKVFTFKFNNKHINLTLNARDINEHWHIITIDKNEEKITLQKTRLCLHSKHGRFMRNLKMYVLNSNNVQIDISTSSEWTDIDLMSYILSYTLLKNSLSENDKKIFWVP